MGAGESKIPPPSGGGASNGDADGDKFSVEFTDSLVETFGQHQNGSHDPSAASQPQGSSSSSPPASLEAAYNKGAEDMRDYLQALQRDDRAKEAEEALAKETALTNDIERALRGAASPSLSPSDPASSAVCKPQREALLKCMNALPSCGEAYKCSAAIDAYHACADSVPLS